MQASPRQIDLDVAVVGGGIAGLWLINRLIDAGYDAALFEQQALGSAQTIASQGMIHGGIKYSLTGRLSGAARATADMPGRWRACLKGEGELDLRDTRLLSDHFYLWSTGGLAANVQSLFASRALRGRVDKVPVDQHPTALAHPDFSGNVYQLNDLVLDVPSLLSNLTTAAAGRVFHATRLQLEREDSLQRKDSPERDNSPERNNSLERNKNQAQLRVESPDGPLHVKARRILLTAGRGNADLLKQLGLDEPAMQTRPLQQLIVEHPSLPSFYGHCLGKGTTPRLTISSHKSPNGHRVWYLGGELAEAGAATEPEALIARGQTELNAIFPWLDLTNAQWQCLTIDRAEPRQPGNKRPDGASLHPVPGLDNLAAAWPTKLTLAPHLSDLILADLDRQGIRPTGGKAALGVNLSPPPVAQTPWADAFTPEDA